MTAFSAPTGPAPTRATPAGPGQAATGQPGDERVQRGPQLGHARAGDSGNGDSVDARQGGVGDQPVDGGGGSGETAA